MDTPMRARVKSSHTAVTFRVTGAGLGAPLLL
jgi:hypothetical protein